MKTPVILFSGFLDAGKTTLLADTLRDEQWRDRSQLVILCEEGEEELSSRRSRQVVTVEDAEQLSEGILESWDRQYQPDVVFIEYNGMWLTHYLTVNLPASWQIVNSYMVADASTFLSYELNIRSLVVDKLAVSQFILFNRWEAGLSQQRFHDIVRKVNLKAQIAFEDTAGELFFDELPVELPYDLTASPISIEDGHFALFARDLEAAPERYLGKCLSFKGKVKEHFTDGFVFGRLVMICCEQDMSFHPVSCKSARQPAIGQWVQVTGCLTREHSEKFNRSLLCLQVQNWEPAQAPAVEVATYS